MNRLTQHNRIVEAWMGLQVETLADLLRPKLRAVCIGINPAPKSVAAGHYYQGALGQGFFRRLRTIKVLRSTNGQWEDDALFANGIGFTDVVKRPTAKASDVREDEYRFGVPILLEKLAIISVPVAIFTFKKAAEKLFGKFSGNGFVSGLKLGRSQVFVMPGPYESGITADDTLKSLSRALKA